MNLIFARDLIFAFCLLNAAVTDLKIMKIPNRILLIIVSAWITECFLRGWGEDFINISHILLMAVFSAAAYGLAYISEKITGKKCLGGGDIKLIGISALYLGFTSELYALIFACILSLAYCKSKKIKICPFGVFISIGAWLALTVQNF